MLFANRTNKLEAPGIWPMSSWSQCSDGHNESQYPIVASIYRSNILLLQGCPAHLDCNDCLHIDIVPQGSSREQHHRDAGRRARGLIMGTDDCISEARRGRKLHLELIPLHINISAVHIYRRIWYTTWCTMTLYVSDIADRFGEQWKEAYLYHSSSPPLFDRAFTTWTSTLRMPSWPFKYCNISFCALSHCCFGTLINCTSFISPTWPTWIAEGCTFASEDGSCRYGEKDDKVIARYVLALWSRPCMMRVTSIRNKINRYRKWKINHVE